MQSGLVSVSFRALSPEEVIIAAVNSGLRCIEWGSDVHAPCTDGKRLEEIASLQKKYGIVCAAYGTYFRLGITPMDALPDYIRAAKVLGTRILRLWCGSKKAEDHSPEERDQLFEQCRQASAMAESTGVILCLECHMDTYTETKEGALELMNAVDSPAFRMYWQPNQLRSVAENLEYARLLKDYVVHIHVFQWKGSARYPLREGLSEWKSYLAQFPGAHTLLLEFMPDDRPESLPEEAAALKQLTGECL